MEQTSLDSAGLFGPGEAAHAPSPAVAAASERRIVLHDVSWPTYVALRDADANRHVRMIYDRGDLEMMSPSQQHERWAYLLGRLVDVWTEEHNIEIVSCRNMTCRREDLGHGLEPDNCYYIRHASQMSSKGELDLPVDPPPDLAIEIDLSRDSTSKHPIYGAMGVPEVWQYDGERIEVLLLDTGSQSYRSGDSKCLPGFPRREAERILAQWNTATDTRLIQSFRQHVQGQQG